MYIPTYQMMRMQFISWMRKDDNMTTLYDMEQLNKMLAGLFEDDPVLTMYQQASTIITTLDVVINYITNMETHYDTLTNNYGARVKDLEHLVVFSAKAKKECRELDDILNSSNIPDDLKGLSYEKYLELLGESLEARRKCKDFYEICRVFREKLTTIKNFITNMDNRMYNAKSFIDSNDDFSDSDEDSKPIVVTRYNAPYKKPGAYKPRVNGNTNNTEDTSK